MPKEPGDQGRPVRRRAVGSGRRLDDTDGSGQGQLAVAVTEALGVRRPYLALEQDRVEQRLLRAVRYQKRSPANKRHVDLIVKRDGDLRLSVAMVSSKFDAIVTVQAVRYLQPQLAIEFDDVVIFLASGCVRTMSS